MGLNTFGYYFVAYVFYLAQYLLMVFLLFVASNLINVQFFTLHSPGIILFILFLWGNTLVAFSFMLSTCFKSRRTVASMSLLILLVSCETGRVLFTEFLNSSSSSAIDAQNILMIWPPWVMSKAVYFIGTVSIYGDKIDSQNWTTIKNGILPNCAMWMLIHWAVNLLLLWYFDSVIPSGNGVPQHPCCCFMVCCKNKSEQVVADDEENLNEDEHDTASLLSAEEIKRERIRVIDYDPSKLGEGDAKLSTRIIGLGKNFKAFQAVRNLSLGVNERECLGVLGSNGAGKSTTISTLTGLHKPSYGEAFVGPYKISENMGKIQEKQGVCVQENVLWEELTGEEHIKF